MDNRLDKSKEQEFNKSNNFPFTYAARDYIKMVDFWFKSKVYVFKEKEKELQVKIDLTIPDFDPKKETLKLDDAVKIIHWYQHQIYIKLMRAIHEKSYEGKEQFDQIQKDSNGSVKVALISIDRSINSWNILREDLSDQDDTILEILIHLDRLRKNIETEFPEARAFIRPGFDET